MAASKSYLNELVERFGDGWNRFWFTPSDPFTLSAIRVLTGLVALGLYLTCYPDLDRLFGPDGVLSHSFALQIRGDFKVFSIFDYAETTSALHAFYWAGAAALVLFLVGFLTRATAVLALVAVLSLIHRGPVLARPVDDIVAMVMLYLCIGPCGAALSIDAWMMKKRRPFESATPSFLGSYEYAYSIWLRMGKPSVGATISQRLIQVHLTAIYAAMAIAKLKGNVWWDGTAVWGLIAKPESRMLDLTALGAAENKLCTYTLNLWTHAIVLFELSFAVLIWNRLARPLLLALALPIWVGTALLTGMASWSLMMLVANLAFISPVAMRGCFSRRAVST